MLTVAELIRYRMAHERYVHRVGEALIDTRFGEFRLIAYESEVDGGESHVALIRGDIERSDTPVLVRMHAHCLMGDVFGVDGLRMPCHAGRLAAPHCRGGPRSADLPASDFAGIFRRRKLATATALDFPSRAEACPRCRTMKSRRSARSALARRFFRI